VAALGLAHHDAMLMLGLPDMDMGWVS